jgi:hypothetical protein
MDDLASQEISNRPITKEAILLVLNKGIHKEDVDFFIEELRSRGVDFQLSASDEDEIRQAGKSLGKDALNHLISSIRANYRPENPPTNTQETRQQEGEPKITGKVIEERGFLFADSENGYLYIVLHVRIKNEGASTAINDYRLKYSFFKEVIEAKSDRCSQFRMVKTPEGTVEVSELNDLREDKTPFRKYYPRDGWLCFKAPIEIRLLDANEYYPHMTEITVEVIDGNDGVHKLDVYPNFAGGEIRRMMGRSLKRIKPPSP